MAEEDAHVDGFWDIVEGADVVCDCGEGIGTPRAEDVHGRGERGAGAGGGRGG